MSTQISVRLSDAMHVKVRQMAEAEGRTVSGWVKRVLEVAANREKVESLVGMLPMKEDREMWEGTRVPKSAGSMFTAAKNTGSAEPSRRVAHPAVSDEEISEAKSKFRTSPDGKQCKHFMLRCDKGCWK